MTLIENAELGAALTRLLQIRGSSALGLSPELVPVLTAGDTQWPPWSRRRPFQASFNITANAGVTGVMLVSNFTIQARTVRITRCSAFQATGAAGGRLELYINRNIAAVSGSVIDVDTEYAPTGNTEVSIAGDAASNIYAGSTLIESRPVTAVNQIVEFESEVWLRPAGSLLLRCTTLATTYWFNLKGYWDP